MQKTIRICDRCLAEQEYPYPSEWTSLRFQKPSQGESVSELCDPCVEAVQRFIRIGVAKEIESERR